MAFGFPGAIFLHNRAFTFFAVFVKLYLLRVWIGDNLCPVHSQETVPYLL